ncbi:very-long-chain 3-oxoacyl-CoA reductase-like [Limulus polyphemus]|uniref:Very-long-chain 3-oxoacyl-CoA reductase-like n=1 Tax=Limulus polyphemus TaxID=6850 RepID=A0ABM1B072_LIMPO|nr:very-long-chain 3-oxoacyl-CoA reductase-like [Limulus polyphemus]
MCEGKQTWNNGYEFSSVSILALVGLTYSVYISLKILLWICKAIYICFLGPKLGMSVNWSKVGRWAVITGATEGIGRSYAEELAARGLNIALISRSVEKLESAATDLEKRHKIKTKTISVDFTNGSEIYDEIQMALQGLEIGVLVNNVGMSFIYPEYFHLIPNAMETMEKIIRVNVIACTRMMRMILPQMEERQCGVVINVSSLLGIYPIPLLSSYSASKSYVDYLSRAIQLEYKKKGIIIQCVMPAFVATQMSKIRRASFNVPTPDEYVKWAIRTVGLETRTYGYPPHRLQGIWYEFLDYYMPSWFNMMVAWRHTSFLRNRFYRKNGLVDPMIAHYNEPPVHYYIFDTLNTNGLEYTQ